MKKLICVLSVFTLILTSCSGDSDSPATPEDGALLTKIITTDPDGTITANLTYNGNKLVSIVDNEGYEENFTYAGDLITSTQEVDGGTVIMNNTFEYNSDGKLIAFNNKYRSNSSRQ